MDISKVPFMNEDAREDAEMERAFSEASKPELGDLLIPSQDLITLEIPPTEWLIEGLVPKGGDTFWSGTSNSYKTFVCLTAGFDISLGRKFLNHFPTNFARSIYIDEENGRKIMAERLKMIGRGEVPDMFFLIETGWQAVETFIKQTAELVSKYEADNLQIDTLRRIIPHGMDENSSGDANMVTAALREIRTRSGRPDLSIWIQHHHTKPNKKEGVESSLRGSSDWTARADAHIILEADDMGGIITFKHQKLRQDRKLLPFSAQVVTTQNPMTGRTETIDFVYMGDGLAKKKDEQAEKDALLLGIVKELNGAGIENILGSLKQKKVYHSRRDVQRWVQEARDKGWIDKVGGGPSTKYFWVDPDKEPEVNTPLV